MKVQLATTQLEVALQTAQKLD